MLEITIVTTKIVIRTIQVTKIPMILMLTTTRRMIIMIIVMVTMIIITGCQC